MPLRVPSSWVTIAVLLLVVSPDWLEITDYLYSYGDSNNRGSLILCNAKERKRKQGSGLSGSVAASSPKPGITFKPLQNQQIMVDTRALPPFIQYWDIAGPFPVGKTEYDGDPLEAYGGIYNLTRPPQPTTSASEPLDAALGGPIAGQQKFLSEFATGGYVSWTRFIPNAEGWVELNFPDVMWQYLVSGLNSVAVLEFQVWAVASFYVHQAGRYFLHCDHVHTVEIDKATQFYHGDIYGTNMPTIMTLSQGLHTIRLRIKARGSGTFRAAFLKEIQPFAAVVYLPAMVPDLVDGYFFGGDNSSYGLFSVRVLNGHTEILHSIAFRVASDDPRLQLAAQQPPQPYSIAPGQVMPIGVRVQFLPTPADASFLSLTEDKCLRFTLTAFGVFGKKQPAGSPLTVERQLNSPFEVVVRCRKADQSFLFGFLDHDGGVSFAAAVRPWRPCTGKGVPPSAETTLMGSAAAVVGGSGGKEGGVEGGGVKGASSMMGGCPILLSLSGVGVKPTNQADSYKYMRKTRAGDNKKASDNSKQWKFGMEDMWILAPERDGAHNWEGTGHLSAMAAVSALSEYTRTSVYRADHERMIFAGHSRGGHGALVAAMRYPDRALAVAPAGGWYSREYYGDANVVFSHDIGMNYLDPSLKAILEATIIENDESMTVDNLKGVPVLLRTGGADTSVSPWHFRRYARLLHAAGAALQWSEVPQQGHWWWDTVYTNDGGVLFDVEMRKFFASADTAGLPAPPESFRLVTYNPASPASRGGVKILQLRVPFKRAVLQFTKLADVWQITTTNVRRFQFYPLAGTFNRTNLLSIKKIMIDNAVFDILDVTHSLFDEEFNFCWDESTGKWKVHPHDAHTFEMTEKGPRNYGPIRQAFQGMFLIVPGTKGTKEENEFAAQTALYLANSHYLSSGSWAPVVPDVFVHAEMAQTHNLMLIGNPTNNLWIDQLSSHMTPKWVSTAPSSSFSSSSSSSSSTPATSQSSSSSPSSSHSASPSSSSFNILLGPCNFSSPGIGMIFLSSQWNAKRKEPLKRVVLTGTDLQGIADLTKFFFSSNLPLTRAAFTNMVPDYMAVHGPTFRAKGYGGVLAAGFFGNKWEWRADSSYHECNGRVI